MDSIWLYLAITVVASIILALAVIGWYECWREIQNHARDRRFERNLKAAQRTQAQKE